MRGDGGVAGEGRVVKRSVKLAYLSCTFETCLTLTRVNEL